MPKYLILLFVLYTYTCLSQTHSKKFIFDQEYHVPIEDVSIIFNNGTMLVTDNSGGFIPPSSPFDTITFSHISYKTEKVAYALFLKTDTFFIKTINYIYEPVSIARNKCKRIGCTAEETNIYDILYPNEFELAQRINLYKSPLKILDFRFYAMEMVSDSLLLSLNFYNLSNGMPGKKIVNQNILFKVGKNKNVSVDLSPYNIIMNDDFVVSVKMVKAYGNAKMPSLKIPCKVFSFPLIYNRSKQTGWAKERKGASLGFNLLAERVL